MDRLIFAALALLAAGLARGQSVDYSIFKLENDTRTLLTKDVRYYSLSDIESMDLGKIEGMPASNRSLQLLDGFRVGITVTGQKERTGLGISVKNDQNPEGFSWEWFEPAEGDLFTKLQGTGYLRVRFESDGEISRVASIEFLDDIELRYQENIRVSQPGDRTHIMVVAKGSVLQVAP
jgi:hypothetical protein